MRNSRTRRNAIRCAVWLAAAMGATGLRAAELSVGDVNLAAGTAGSVVVSGTLTNEITFGVTILVELVPQGGNTGTVTFTPAPPTDIVQINDLWASAGTLTLYDSDAPGFSDTLNGVVDDDGRFLCDTPVTFSGDLVEFPIIASADATGVWDVVLSTSVGDSNWECMASTTLIGGTVTVASVECLGDGDCDDANVCTDDTCNAGVCEHVDNTLTCDDGSFCTLNDVCGGGTCVGSGDPCPGDVCDEVNDICVPPPPSLTALDLELARGDTAMLEVFGENFGSPTIGVTVLVEIVPRAGTVGSVLFTPGPPSDIVQLGDPWLGTGTFSTYDTHATGFGPTINGSVDDNGTFVPASVTYSGLLSGFPVTASSDAGGVWDVMLTTSAGDSEWEGVSTIRNGGTISVAPSSSLTVASRAMPPGSVVDVVVNGAIENESSSSVDILLEIVSRAGNTGTLQFTGVYDIVELGNPWGATGTFSGFDAGDIGFSATLNGSVHGTFQPELISFDGPLTAFPVTASANADGVWDLVLVTSSGTSGWEGVLTALAAGTITVSPSACLIDADCDDSNTCTMETCVAGICEYVTVVGACDDGDLCTIDDTCAGDVCSGTPVDCSGLDDACNIGTCNAGTGTCEPVPANEGGACDDGQLCTENDACSAGVCVGSDVDCSGLDDTCNVGSCNVSTGACEAIPANEGGACDDGSLCTENDSCAGGVCQGTAVDCSDLNSACSVGECDNADGSCFLVPVFEGFSCNDNNRCTEGDKCVSGVCTGTPKNCNGMTNACNNGVCNGATGSCQAIPTNDGGSCNDGDPCTDTDTCSNGICDGTSIPGCVNCVGPSQCDDGNFCTGDSCVGGACQHVDLTVACDDGDLCTVNDVCSGGSCGGTPVDCSGLDDDCHVGMCRASTGTCRSMPANDGGPCDDGLTCTINDQCNSGTCSGTLDSPPSVDLFWSPSSQSVQSGDTFTVDLVAASGTCIDQPIGSVETILIWDVNQMELLGRIDTGPISWLISGFPDDSGIDGLNAPFNGTIANDGDALYQALSGSQNGAAIPPSGVVVTTFEFRALGGSLGTPIDIAPTAGSYSKSRVIGAGQDLGMDVTGSLGSASITIVECQNAGDCNDGNICTNDSCNSGVCQHTNNTVSCDDGLFCTSGDACSGGVCTGGSNPCSAPLLCSESLSACVECLSAADCDDGNECTDDVCGGSGSCSNPNNSDPCDDGVFCTATDTCSGGACVGTGDACPGAVCDEPNNRCVECLGDGDCDDGNVCTTDSCSGNVCSHDPNALSCDDGLFCTVTDSCVGGTCVGSTNPCSAPLICSEVLNSCVECEVDADCDDGNLCTTDVCFFNTCSNTNNVAPCDDGLFCTTDDACSGGACVGTGDACPGQLCDESNDGCVDCFTLSDCPDDNVSCTIDACVDGECLHEPTDALCDDGLFCNGSEFCNALLGCRAGTSPCDDEALCVESNQSCGCREPIVVAEGCRYLAVTPRSGQTPVALLVSGVDPSVDCVSKYVQADGTLGGNPVFKPPAGPNGWNTVHVRGLDIIPETSYIVQTECDTLQGMGVSTPAESTTWIWGDADNSGGLIDIRDITLIVEGFEGNFSVISRYNVDLWGPTPEDCHPRLIIELIDIVMDLEAFQGFPFPCADRCP